MYHFHRCHLFHFSSLKIKDNRVLCGCSHCAIRIDWYGIVIVNWANSTPMEPIRKGLYRYSRHPMYVTYFLVFLGTSIATASWLFVLFLILFTVGTVAFVDFEEQGCLEQYGDIYREYMDRTPRWIGIPKSKVN